MAKRSSARGFTLWAVTDAEARTKKMMRGREGAPGGDYNSRYETLTTNFNGLPPGMDIEDQEVTDQRQMGINTAGQFPTELAAGDYTQEVTAEVLRKGFARKALLSTDDAYTREHNDAFYDEVRVGGDAGFVERNNMLDRL